MIDPMLLNQIYAVAHGEARGQSDDFKINVISSLLNRADNFNKYWKFRGTYENMLQEEYYAVRDSASGKNTGYGEAMEFLTKKKPFKSKTDEDDFKRTLQLTSGVINGKIKRSETQFYFNAKELKSAKKSMDFDLLQETGEFQSNTGTTYKSFSYKP